MQYSNELGLRLQLDLSSPHCAAEPPSLTGLTTEEKGQIDELAQAKIFSVRCWQQKNLGE